MVQLDHQTGPSHDRGVFDAVAGALERDDIGVMHDPIDHGRGDGGFAEDLSPAGERQVGSQDDRRFLVAGGGELEGQVRYFGVERGCIRPPISRVCVTVCL